MRTVLRRTRRSGRTWGAAVSLTVLACAPLPPGSGAPAGGSVPDERVLIGSFAVIDAVAVSRRFVFTAGPGGVVVYDRATERFMPPPRDLDRELGNDVAFTAPGMGSLVDDVGRGVPITVMAGDPVEDAVWIGVPGAVVSYRPFTGQVQRTIVTGVPQRIVFDRTGPGDALVQSGGTWTRVSRVGLAMPVGPPVGSQVLVPPTLPDLLARYPGLRAQPLAQLRQQMPNRPLGPVALTAGAAALDRASEVWLGTDGDGLFRVDPVFGQGNAVRYGLLDPGAGAVAAAVNGVWVAGLGLSSRRGGLTFGTTDLQHWRWIEGTIAVPLAGVRVNSLVTRGNRAWLGTARGLVRVQLDGTHEMEAYTTLRGLPDDQVYAVAARDDGVWTGTARGLVYVTDSLGVGAPVIRDVPVYALQVTGATLWAGTQRGLVALPADARGARAVMGDAPRAASGGDPALRTAVRALAASDSVLLAVTDDVVLQLDSRAGAATQRAERLPTFDVRPVGPVTRAAADDRTVAVTGANGVVLWSRRTGARRELRAPFDLPGPVFDVLLQRDFVFLATPRGLLRYRRTSDGLVP